MTTLRIILGDQLSHGLASLRDIGAGDVVLMCEVMSEATYVKHHPKKIAFLFAAMRHFAAELRGRGVTVRYVPLDDGANTQDLTTEVARAIADLGASHVIVTEAGEYRVQQMILGWADRFGITVDIRCDDRFLCRVDQFNGWADGKTQLRMEYFYRDMRKRYQILMHPSGDPIGGAWNFDKDNRKPPVKGLTSPRRIAHPRSDILSDVLHLVNDRFGDHFGDLEPFHYAVTRDQAMIELDHFITHLLPQFGDYQDAMVTGEAYLFHSLLASYLNAGLLDPLEVCQAAEAAYHAHTAPLNAVEGFIRQILGWREFIRGIYWRFMPDYGAMNYLDAHTPLPDFYWGAPTQMRCIADAVDHTRRHAYSHHIQRLMVTGNFALLAGLDVQAVQDWYLAVYSDAYEWVEMPNTLGMALFGDGGIVGSKPYAASGKYINRMSTHCKGCRYNPNGMLEEDACPFNALYWDFLARHQAKLQNNHRLPYVYNTWSKFGADKQSAIRAKARSILSRMQEGGL